MTALMGPSGSGKSSLLAAIAGLVTPAGGTIEFDGLKSSDIALVTQTPAILPHRTVRDNIALGALSAGASYAFATGVAQELIAELGLNAISDAPARQISGGERQRMAITRVIARGASALLADEPTSSLDRLSRMSVIDCLSAASERGAIVVIATHDEYVASRCQVVLRPWHLG